MRGITRRLGDQDGQALIIALIFLVLGLGLAFGALTYALNVNHQGNNDERTRAAQQASDAGVQSQLLDQTDSNSVAYNLNGGPLGLTTLLDCTVPEFNLGVQVGSVQLAVNKNGGCPAAVQSGCTASSTCTTITNPWEPVSNGEYDESEFFPNAQTQAASGTTPSNNGYAVEFPEIDSVGCKTSAQGSAAPTSCSSGASTNQYSRQLAVLQPTAPLQAAEAENNLAITGGPSSLLSGVIGIIDGNVTAGNYLYVPAVGIDLQLSGLGILSTLSSLFGGAGVTQLNDLSATLAYGKGLCQYSASSYSASTCSSATGLSTLAANTVQDSAGVCTAGNPSSDCSLARPTITNIPTSNLPSGGSYSSAVLKYTPATYYGCFGFCPSTSSETYANDDLTVTNNSNGGGGTLQFLQSGSYYFCNFNAGNASVSGPTGGSVQIFILPPSECNGSSTGIGSSSSAQGNFIAGGGVNNGGSAINLTGLTGITDPSGFQIYVAGNSSDNLTVGSTVQPSTQVTLSNANNLTSPESAIIYAPRSNVNVSGGTANLGFVGSAVGWNVSVSAAAVLQDLDVGNYPLSSVVNAYQPAQTIQCNVNGGSQLNLTGSSSDLSGC